MGKNYTLISEPDKPNGRILEYHFWIEAVLDIYFFLPEKWHQILAKGTHPVHEIQEIMEIWL